MATSASTQLVGMARGHPTLHALKPSGCWDWWRRRSIQPPNVCGPLKHSALKSNDTWNASDLRSSQGQYSRSSDISWFTQSHSTTCDWLTLTAEPSLSV